MENTQSKNPIIKGGYFVIGETPPEELFIAEEFDEEAKMMGIPFGSFVSKKSKNLSSKAVRS